MSHDRIRNLVLAALFLALGMVLPFLTGQIPQIGKVLSPMHIPAFLCGFVCGWPYGLAIGFIMPLLRSVLFGMPQLIPSALVMAFELAAYGCSAAVIYRLLPKRPAFIYVTLIASMLIGRVVWGLASLAVYRLFTENSFTLAAFLAGAFINAVPGIILHIVLVPAVVMALERADLIDTGGI